MPNEDFRSMTAKAKADPRPYPAATRTSVGDWLLAERMRRTQGQVEVSAHSIERIAELVCPTATPLEFGYMVATRNQKAKRQPRRIGVSA